MAGKYPAYPEYKDTQVEWLGNVPTDWKLSRIKYLCYVNDGNHGEEYPKEADYTDKDNGVPFIRGGNMEGHAIVDDGMLYISKTKNNSMRKGRLERGDILFMNRGEIGKLALITETHAGANLNSQIAYLRSYRTEVVNKYLLYYLASGSVSNLLASMKMGSVLTQFPIGNLLEIYVPLPSDEEQQKIANFLDHEIAKIDTLIDKQQQLIKLLKEKRQAVISHAVTKGLNPDAPMRYSGIEWLGEVPEGWDVNNINYVINAIGDVDHYMPQSVEKGIPYVMTGDLKELASSINFEGCKQVSHENYLKLSKKIKNSRGDVIMARYATIGTASYIDVDADFLVSYSCVTIKPNLSKVSGLYLFYYFKSDAFLQGIKNQINTNTQENVGVNDLKKVKVALPTLAEQSKIIEYLQSKISKLDSISDRSQAAIDLMKERRTALISAAVTGKFDVRNWQPPEPLHTDNNNNKEVVV